MGVGGEGDLGHWHLTLTTGRLGPGSDSLCGLLYFLSLYHDLLQSGVICLYGMEQELTQGYRAEKETITNYLQFTLHDNKMLMHINKRSSQFNSHVFIF